MCFTPQLNPLKTPLNPLNVIRDPKSALNPKSFLSSQSPKSLLTNPMGPAKDIAKSSRNILS